MVSRIIMLILFASGCSSFAGAEMVVAGGTVYLAGNDFVATGTITLQAGAEMVTTEGSTLTAEQLTIQTGGLLRGCGWLYAVILNSGEMIADCGSNLFLQLRGQVTNQGAVRLFQNAGLLQDTPGTFINQGVVDIVQNDNFNVLYDQENSTGSIITDLPGMRVTPGPSNVLISFLGLGRRTYRLFEATSLTNPDWQEVGAQTGTDSTIEISRPAPSSGSPRFYQYTLDTP